MTYTQSATDKWVIGNAAAEPWLLTLTPTTQSGAERAVSWQRVGQGQFDPLDYWRIVSTDELRSLLPTMTRSPYTQEAWNNFLASFEREAT